MTKTKCPACEGKGYFIKPAVSIVRCECCEGHGVATDMQIFVWEVSL